LRHSELENNQKRFTVLAIVPDPSLMLYTNSI